MYLQQFPDLKWLKKEVENQFESKKGWQGLPLAHDGWPSVVLNVKTNRTYRDNIKGPLSLFGNMSGVSHVTIGKRRVTIPPGYFFITNEGQEYTLEVDKQPTETFNIHFGNHFVRQALQLATHSFEPETNGSVVEFRNRMIPFDGYAREIARKIQRNESSIAEEENLHELFNYLMGREEELNHQKKSLSSWKKSTQEEIMNRLLVAVDYTYSFSNKELSLDVLAQVACLSKFHFLRSFKSTFQKTPHQFLNEVRVMRAKEYLKKGDLTVSEVAHQTGFDSSRSFSRVFTQIVGAYPSQFQQIKN